jgi:hypothetical protein
MLIGKNASACTRQQFSKLEFFQIVRSIEIGGLSLIQHSVTESVNPTDVKKINDEQLCRTKSKINIKQKEKGSEAFFFTPPAAT